MIKDQERRLKQTNEKKKKREQSLDRIAAHLQMIAGQLDHLANKIF